MITDPAASALRPLTETVAQAIEGGADVIQLRDKSASDEELLRLARALMAVTRPKGVPLIVNDRVSVAVKAEADGVHLGQGDGPLRTARRALGEEAIIGRSTHSPEQALEAEREGFDYIGVGPVFQTPTKPTAQPVGLDLVRFASQQIRIPFVAIGGVDASNAGRVIEAGASTIAVVRAVMAAASPRQASQELLSASRVRA